MHISLQDSHHIILIDPYAESRPCDFVLQTLGYLSQRTTVTRYQPFKILSGIPSFLMKLRKLLQMSLLVLLQFFWSIQGKKVLLWFMIPIGFPVIKLPGTRVIYDCVDIMFSEQYPRDPAYIYAQRLLDKADVITAIAESQKKALQHLTQKEVYVVPQGFAHTEFKAEQYKLELRRERGPVVGILGSINQRIDFTLLLELIERNPTWRFRIYGQVVNYIPECEEDFLRSIKRLQSCSNVSFHVAHGKGEVARALDTFGALFIPYHADNRFNQCSYPMKVMEALYMGVPIISTAVEELQRYPEYFTVIESAEEASRALQLALEHPPSFSKRSKMRAFAESNSWQQKAEHIFLLLEEKLA